MLSSGNFPETAWRAVHSRQAAHAENAYSGFLGRNRLAVHTRLPGGTYPTARRHMLISPISGILV